MRRSASALVCLLFVTVAGCDPAKQGHDAREGADDVPETGAAGELGAREKSPLTGKGDTVHQTVDATQQ